MATRRDDFDDSTTAVRRRFLLAVASARPPIRAKDLLVAGLDRRTIQKRLERLRRETGDVRASDEEVIAHARDELDRFASPVTRGLTRLRDLGAPLAREFAASAGLQTTVIGDWVELAHSPGDLGWTRSQIAVQELSRGSVLGRGKAQSWLKEKKAFLKETWPAARHDPQLRRNLVPNRLRMDLLQLSAAGTEDSPLCALQIGAIDWLSCLALNSRLDDQSLTGEQGRTVRERWGAAGSVVERRSLPGMLVAHVVVKTSDNRLLVCQRQPRGVQDEPGTWSLSIEERWSGPLYRHGERRPADAHPHDLVRRGVKEELGIDVSEKDIRVLSWGIEASVLYPGFIAVAETSLGSWQIEGMRAHAADANEIRFVASVGADLSSLALLMMPMFEPEGRPDLAAAWHRTSKARLFCVLAHLRVESNGERDSLLAELGHQETAL